MVDNYYAYVQNRMRQMGYDKFSIEPAFINVAATELTIDAQNRWYYLVSESVDPTIKIIADNNAFNDGANFGTFNFNYLQEFTGQIDITQDNPIQLEFIIVTPE